MGILRLVNDRPVIRGADPLLGTKDIKGALEAGKKYLEKWQKYEKELADIETTARAKIQVAVADANKLAAGIKEDARKETVALRVKTNQDIELELDKANVALRDRMVNAVITAFIMIGRLGDSLGVADPVLFTRPVN